GLSLNERTSVSWGFEFDYVFPTDTETSLVDTTKDPPIVIKNKVRSDPLYIGSFIFGWSYQISENIGLNLNFQIGATDNAPDFQTTLRVPTRFDVFYSADHRLAPGPDDRRAPRTLPFKRGD